MRKILHHQNRSHQVTLMNSSLFMLGGMLFFLMLFDGMLGFAVPILITNAGMSKSMMGVIIGSSSIVGASFDFILSEYVRSIHYRRMFLIMFVVCALYAATLQFANTAIFFILAMGMWGIYYDLQNFGNNDFIARSVAPSRHTEGYSVIDLAKSLGYVLAPIIAGIFVTSYVSPVLFGVAYIFLLLSVMFYIVMLVVRLGRYNFLKSNTHPKRPAWNELSTWVRTMHQLRVPLIFIFILYVTESFFWSIGPLISEELAGINPLGGLILTAYFFPPLILDWFVPNIVQKYGKKRTAFIAFLIGTILMSLIYFTTSVTMLITLIFLLACCFTLSYPSIKSAVIDYITENPHLENEIQGVADFSTNIAYVLGPMLAGLLADRVGNYGAFSIWGFLGVIIILFLLPSAKKDIRIKGIK